MNALTMIDRIKILVKDAAGKQWGIWLLAVTGVALVVVTVFPEVGLLVADRLSAVNDQLLRILDLANGVISP